MQITRDDIREFILVYLDLIANGRGSAEENVQALGTVLDKLALARSYAEYQSDEGEYPDAPRHDYKRLRELASRQFPEFGFYNLPEAITDKVGEAEMMMGDAIDDLADIASDLTQVIWRWEHNSPDDALFYFQILYDGHWGEHLRNLQFYVHYFKNRL